MDHKLRRAEFAERIGSGAIAVIPAAIETPRNDDVDHEFRQDSNFYFLTGFDEPEAVAVIDPDGADQFVLFVRPRDREMEIWTGHRAGIDGARERFGADAAFTLDELGGELRRRFEGKEAVYYRLQSRIDDTVLGALGGARQMAIRYGITAPDAVIDPSKHLAAMRQHKNPAEVEALVRAADISVDGHLEAMRVTRPATHEYVTQAAMEHVFRRAGSPRNGYPSIVASGPNACILHYVDNGRLMEDGDLLLIDAAAEYDHHSADITRTFPVGDRFTAPQRAVYDVVLAAQQAAIAAAEMGVPFSDLTDVAVRVISEGLVDLGLVPGSVDETIEMHHYREYFMHGLGHWLGMDVHDAGPYRTDGQPVSLAEGMAFTVEPGIYVDPERSEVEFTFYAYDIHERLQRRMRLGSTKAKELEAEEESDASKVTHEVPAEMRGIGVRIEDDILMAADGPRNLTERLPVEADEIESIRQG